MFASISINSRFLAAAIVLIVAAGTSMAQETGTSASGEVSHHQPKTHATVKTHKSTGETRRNTASNQKKKEEPSHFGTEGEASAHCHSTVVWVDTNHFNHYAGSREYGRKPGYFTCENG